MIVYAKDAITWHPNPSTEKVPTIRDATESGDTGEAHATSSGSQCLITLDSQIRQAPRRILQIAAGSDALVLGPFAGSGTTARVVLEQNASGGDTQRFVLIVAKSVPETHPPPARGDAGQSTGL